LLLYTFDILQDFIVPEPQDPVTLGFEMANARCVVGGAFRMLATVNLYGQAFFHAHEIDYVIPYWMLSSKPELADLTHSQVTPQQFLSIGRAASQLA
jgi:hypothetical protein